MGGGTMSNAGRLDQIRFMFRWIKSKFKYVIQIPGNDVLQEKHNQALDKHGSAKELIEGQNKLFDIV